MMCGHARKSQYVRHRALAPQSLQRWRSRPVDIGGRVRYSEGVATRHAMQGRGLRWSRHLNGIDPAVCFHVSLRGIRRVVYEGAPQLGTSRCIPHMICTQENASGSRTAHVRDHRGFSRCRPMATVAVVLCDIIEIHNRRNVCTPRRCLLADSLRDPPPVHGFLASGRAP
eukprot:m.330149 g.330149  ORF g.330149 m.330149 type:complete len:170 (-) comp20457_c0_seq4:316-825(-)